MQPTRIFGQTSDGKVIALKVVDNSDETASLQVDIDGVTLSAGKVPVTDPTTLPLPTGAATAALQSALAALVGEVQASPTENTVLDRLKDLLTGISLASGTNFIGRSGVKSFKFVQSFTRPADTTAYTAGDAVSNSTSSPAIMNQDLASFGAVAGQFLVITNVQVISSLKNTGLSLAAWIFNQTFTATNDNSELSIDDATVAAGGHCIKMPNIDSTALNTKCSSDPGQWVMKLADAGTSLFAALQANPAGYTPGNAATYTLVIDGYLL